MKTIHIISISLIVIVLIGLLIGNRFKNGQVIIKANGQLKTVILPDSSRITLDKNSQLEYNRAFKEKQVRIQGKAEIEVASASIGDFFIDQPLVEIQLNGTDFYFNEDTLHEVIDIVSIDGSARIDIKNTSGQSLFTLDEGDELRFNTDSKLIQTLPTSNQNYLFWKNAQVTFNNNLISEIIMELKALLGIVIKVNHPNINNCSVSGTFSTEDINILVQSIANTAELQLNTSSESFVLLGEGCVEEPIY